MKGLLKARAILSGIVFIIVGIGLIAASIFVSTQSKTLDGLTTATIVNIVESEELVNYGDDSTLETVYTQYISYEVDGVKYENIEFGQCDESAKIGDSIEIKYDTNDPTRITNMDTKTPIIVGIAGGVGILVGIVSILKFIFKR